MTRSAQQMAGSSLPALTDGSNNLSTEAPHISKGDYMPDESKPNGQPFGNTAWGEDTGFRYQTAEIRVGRDFVHRDIWRVYATGPGGCMPHKPLLVEHDGDPRDFESKEAAWTVATQLFRTVH